MNDIRTSNEILESIDLQLESINAELEEANKHLKSIVAWQSAIGAALETIAKLIAEQ